MSSQGFATISDGNCVLLDDISELVYSWNSLNPQALMNGRCVTLLQQQLNFSLSVLTYSSSQGDLYSFSDFFPLMSEFIPSSHHFPFQSRQGI